MIADSIRRAALDWWPDPWARAVRKSAEYGIVLAMLEGRELAPYLYGSTDTERRTFWLIVAEALS